MDSDAPVRDVNVDKVTANGRSTFDIDDFVGMNLMIIRAFVTNVHNVRTPSRANIHGWSFGWCGRCTSTSTSPSSNTAKTIKSRRCFV
jgi:hypothetical protein